MTAALRLLAIDSSTDTLSVALGDGASGNPLAEHTGPGAAQASLSLLPTVQRLLAAADWPLESLDAIVFGQGPGSFTGLRTACAVAQGLAYGARSERHPRGLPVLAVDSLHALAQAAWQARTAAGQALPAHIAALLDARMGECYVALYGTDAGGAVTPALCPPRLCRPTDLNTWLADAGAAAATRHPPLLAGNVFEVYAPALAAVPGERQSALPTATALLSLAPALLAQGRASPAHDAQPLYVRDKVALTTAERERDRP